MPRYKLTIEYDGGPFVGWQRQDSGPSIQAALEDAIFAFTGERVHVQGAGRTDAGVHARGQVAHFDLANEKPTEEVRGALNFHLKPHPIVVPAVELAAPDQLQRTGQDAHLVVQERSRADLDVDFIAGALDR